MAKRKRGGFSFLDVKKPKVEVKKVVRKTVTSNTPAIRIIENKANTVDLFSYSLSAKHHLCQICGLNNVEVSQIYEGPHSHHYFYIYLYMTSEEIERAKQAIAFKFQQSIMDKSIIATYMRNAVVETLVAPEQQKLPVRSIPVNAISTSVNTNRSGRRGSEVQAHVSTPVRNVYSVFSVSMLDTIVKINSYGAIFGSLSLPEEKLKDTIKRMKEKSAWKVFTEKMHSLSKAYTIQIDDKSYGFGYGINFKELTQARGNSLMGKCNFKAVSSSILIDTKSQTIMITPNKKMRSAIVFDYVTDNWQMVTYILFSFFSSECRYKRSFLPMQMLKAIGIIKIRRAFRTKDDNCFVSGRWFLLPNIKNEVQQAYSNEAEKIGIMNGQL